MRNLIFGIDYNTLSSGRFTTTTGGTVPGLPFNVDLDDTHFRSVTARLSVLLKSQSNRADQVGPVCKQPNRVPCVSVAGASSDTPYKNRCAHVAP